MRDLERDISNPDLVAFMNFAITLKMNPSELMKELENSICKLNDFHQVNDDTE